MSLASTLSVTAPGEREIVIRRVFNAPRRLVYEAMNRPEFLQRWMFGPPGWTMTVCEIDARVGGAFKHVWRNEDGREMAMSGVYREVVPGERVVRTETFDVGCVDQAGEQVATMVLVEQGGQTTMTLTVVYPSKEARDGMLASGMETGLEAGYDRLEEVLASMPR